MVYDFCLGCGVILPPQVYECPICGFDNGFSDYDEDPINDDFLIDGTMIFSRMKTHGR